MPTCFVERQLRQLLPLARFLDERCQSVLAQVVASRTRRRASQHAERGRAHKIVEWGGVLFSPLDQELVQARYYRRLTTVLVLRRAVHRLAHVNAASLEIHIGP